MTYSGLAVGLADELYAALRNSTTQYNLCFTASVSVREASHLLNHQTFHLLIADLEYEASIFIPLLSFVCFYYTTSVKLV